LVDFDIPLLDVPISSFEPFSLGFDELKGGGTGGGAPSLAISIQLEGLHVRLCHA
jgi:hypothetical protein